MERSLPPLSKPGEAKPSLPKILCLHGAGTSAAIMRIQAIRLINLLRPNFEFVFLDGPLESVPGPGVLPVFEGFGPYKRWMTNVEEQSADALVEERIKVLEMVKDAVERNGPFVGIFGFSQGARISCGLLLLQQESKEPLTNFQFGILAGAPVPPADFLSLPANRNNLREPLVIYDPLFELWGTSQYDYQPPDPRTRLRIPTLHVHGLSDPWLERQRLLLHTICDPRSARVYEFQGGHRLPAMKGNNDMLSKLFIQLHERSKNHPPLNIPSLGLPLSLTSPITAIAPDKDLM
ncbi:hypothetical protein MMC25_008051 [Agyrium rufum]|nr:hypothetical protein [Agyrium rufum]